MVSSKNTRSDAWAIKDDTILAETVLRHIREGSSQLNAFVECATLLGRTSAACGFRWNGIVRKQYIDQRKAAKTKRKDRTAVRKAHKTGYDPYVGSDLSSLIKALKRHEMEYMNLMERTKSLETQVAELEEMVIMKSFGSSNMLALLNQAKQLLDLEKQDEYQRDHKGMA